MTLDTWLVLGILIVDSIGMIFTIHGYFVARREFKQEYDFDKNIYEKKQRKTRTTKKTVTLPSGDVVTEENTESVESKGEK